MIEVRTHDGLPPADVTDGWARLTNDDPDATLFQTPRFLRVWVDRLGGEVDPRVRTFHRGETLFGVVPEERVRLDTEDGTRRVVRFLGGTEVSDYLGPVASRDDREELATVWLEALADDGDWDEVHAGGLAEDTGWPDLLRAAAAKVGLEVAADEVEDVCPRVSLEGGYEAYLDRLPSKQRTELRRKARKLARDAGELELVAVPPEDVEEGLAAFFDMASRAEGEKGRFFVDDRMRGFFTALAGEFAADGTLRVHLLRVGGQVGAATVSLVHGREWGLYNSSFDQVLRSLAPGMVLVGELIEIAAGEGLDVLDLLRGDEPYKYRFGATDRRLHRLTLTRT